MSVILTGELGVAFDQQMARPAVEVMPTSFAELGNRGLPIYDRKAEIIDTIRGNAITVLVAETGAGKSTQVPQYALEAGFQTVFLTQPRRRAAANVAERIELELSEVVGQETAAQLVSFQTGAGLEGPRDARIKVVTDGLHLNRDGRADSDRDNELWIIDEVHEWNENLEMLVLLGKQRRASNPNFKMILMSATLDAHELADYLTDDQGQVPPVVEVAGRTFNVEYKEKPDSTVAKETVAAAVDIFENPESYDSANTIQVFAEGKAEIKDIIDKIRTLLPFEVLKQTTLIPLDAKMTPDRQAPAYEDMPGVKIVVQTKMGQTSMTIPRTRYVISTGMERRIELDGEDSQGLLRLPISQDDLEQQMGRAGRTCDGIGILTRLDERTTFLSKADRDRHPVPEILRSDIDRLTLFWASLGKDIAEQGFYHPLAQARFDRSKQRVQTLGGLDADGNITTMGKRMSELPLRLPMGRALIHAERLYPQVASYMAAIAASKEVGGLRLFERDGTRRWQSLTDEVTSDHLAQLDIFIAIQNMSLEEMHDYDLDTNNVIRAREHYAKVARHVSVDGYKPLALPTIEERTQLRECIAAGLVNSIYLPVGEGRYRLLGESVVLREVSNRSVTLGTISAVVGDPRRVQIVRAGVSEMKHIIEDATEITVAEIGKIATHLTRWKPTGFTMRGGKFMQVEQQLLDTIVLQSREVAATPSPLLRAAVIEHAKVSPGQHLTELYKIKRAIERLAHKSKVPIMRLTEDAINDLINLAAPATVNDPGLIDNNLRILIEEQAISLDKYVSREQREQIVADAPPIVTIDDVTLGIKYVQGRAIVKRFSLEAIQKLTNHDALYLQDGREISFIYGEKRCSLQQLKKRLENDNLL
ncbi:MAG: helicase-related protein [Patescibacteria group bacterium]|nr:helicase-related protein [Patescibacteria group bacterium]